jgi:hypothetical protein
VVAAADVAEWAAGRVTVEQPVTMEAATSTAASGTATARRRGTGASSGCAHPYPAQVRGGAGLVVSR